MATGGKMPKRKRTLLIDADTLAFRYSSSAEVATDWGEGRWTLHADFIEASDKMDYELEELLDKLNATDLVIALSDPESRYWRHKILPTYKEGRADKRKPMILEPLKQYLEDNYPSYRKPRLEADDIIGILATHPRLVRGEKVIVGIDKDFKTIPGLRHVPSSQDTEGIIEETSQDDADRYHIYQSMTGDSTDGYKGCPGIGPVTADRILANGDNLSEWWGLALGACLKKITEHEFLTQARVARILRAEDYDFRRRKVKLWKPPTVEST